MSFPNLLSSETQAEANPDAVAPAGRRAVVAKLLRHYEHPRRRGGCQLSGDEVSVLLLLLGARSLTKEERDTIREARHQATLAKQLTYDSAGRRMPVRRAKTYE